MRIVTSRTVKNRNHQVNFRCEPQERAAYRDLADKLGEPLSFIIRKALNRMVQRHLGAKALEEK